MGTVGPPVGSRELLFHCSASCDGEFFWQQMSFLARHLVMNVLFICREPCTLVPHTQGLNFFPCFFSRLLMPEWFRHWQSIWLTHTQTRMSGSWIPQSNLPVSPYIPWCQSLNCKCFWDSNSLLCSLDRSTCKMPYLQILVQRCRFCQARTRWNCDRWPDILVPRTFQSAGHEMNRSNPYKAASTHLHQVLGAAWEGHVW